MRRALQAVFFQENFVLLFFDKAVLQHGLELLATLLVVGHIVARLDVLVTAVAVVEIVLFHIAENSYRRTANGRPYGCTVLEHPNIVGASIARPLLAGGAIRI